MVHRELVSSHHGRSSFVSSRVSGVHRYPDRCQGCAGTLISVRHAQVPWSVSGVCRYPDRCQVCMYSAGTLIGVRCVQVPWSVSWVCMYPAETLFSVGCVQAGILTGVRCVLVPWPVSWVCMYPDTLLSILTGVVLAETGLLKDSAFLRVRHYVTFCLLPHAQKGR